jgi:hypothetical protein
VLSDTGGTIVVADGQGFHRTIDTTGSTTYSEAGATVSSSTVSLGVDVVAYGSIAANHTDLDAATVEVVGPVTAGKVTKVSGTNITVSALQGGGSVTISTTHVTVFRTDGKVSSISSVKVGDLLVAIGTRESAHAFAASSVRFGTLGNSHGGAGRGHGPGGGGFRPFAFGGEGFGHPGGGGFGGSPGGTGSDLSSASLTS